MNYANCTRYTNYKRDTNYAKYTNRRARSGVRRLGLRLLYELLRQLAVHLPRSHLLLASPSQSHLLLASPSQSHLLLASPSRSHLHPIPRPSGTGPLTALRAPVRAQARLPRFSSVRFIPAATFPARAGSAVSHLGRLLCSHSHLSQRPPTAVRSVHRAIAPPRGARALVGIAEVDMGLSGSGPKWEGPKWEGT
jgi:hypothetical protein